MARRSRPARAGRPWAVQSLDTSPEKHVRPGHHRFIASGRLHADGRNEEIGLASEPITRSSAAWIVAVQVIPEIPLQPRRADARPGLGTNRVALKQPAAGAGLPDGLPMAVEQTQDISALPFVSVESS